jgi:hypothetical protein
VAIINEYPNVTANDEFGVPIYRRTLPAESVIIGICTNPIRLETTTNTIDIIITGTILFAFSSTTKAVPSLLISK